jgi:antirestriction protein ArdC
MTYRARKQANYKTPQAQEERRARVEAAKEALCKGVEALSTTEGWRAMLESIAQARQVAARISPRRLSFRNQVILTMSGAYEPVATFATWKALGRFPKKGSKATYILQPRTWKAERQNAAGETVEVGGLCFQGLPVFPVSVTEGEPLPEAPKVTGEVDATQTTRDAFEAMAAMARTLPNVSALEVKKDAEGTAYGWYEPLTRRIVVRDTGNAAHMTKTLCHELAHSLLHGDAQHHEYAKNEVEAESVAFVVCSALGIETADYSFPYVSVWAGEMGAHKAVLEAGQRIVETANRILDTIAPQAAEAETEVAA